MTHSPTTQLAFIGGGNMANALAAGLIDKVYTANSLHAIDPNPDVLAHWEQKGATTATQATDTLASCPVWLFCVKPQFLEVAVKQCRPFLQPDTLVISVAAGISATTLSQWLGQDGQAHHRLIRCMPNTPALVGAGVTGMMALSGVDKNNRHLAQSLMEAVGQVVWVDNDAAIDAVTALSGSGPAYVFLFLEALIAGGQKLGLTTEQSRQLALATLSGAVKQTEHSDDALSVLRERVTSKGGTTAAALDVFQQHNFTALIGQAMQAAFERASQLSKEFS